ncbi:MAG: HAMP domain-containing histidine kinase [Clostridia bacterium]|nr:HAMP domain-containing histidine kinase [Clostridia bacterium]
MKRDGDPKRSFNAILLTYIFMLLVMSGALTGIFYLILIFFGFLPGFLFTLLTSPFGVIVAVILITLVLSPRIGRARFRPINDVIRAMSKVSQGDFSVRVDEEGAVGDMRALSRSFNEMTQELGSIEMFRKDFINNFSHEFKTPIVSIRGFAKQLERDDLTPEQRREYTSIIVSESERLANMSSNILLLTKLENQQIVTDKAEFRLDEQLRNAILLLEKQWSAKDIELSLNLEEVIYVGNEEMMSHIWVNLIGNAIKFSPEGGLLEISLIDRDGAAEIVVRDHGEGMDEDTQKRIFEKFYQGDSAHATEGNGLGLSLVKRIVDLCGGSIAVDSRKGEGTAFAVTLPRK